MVYILWVESTEDQWKSSSRHGVTMAYLKIELTLCVQITLSESMNYPVDIIYHRNPCLWPCMDILICVCKKDVTLLR